MIQKPKNKDPIAKQIGARLKQVREMAGYKTQQDLNDVLKKKYGWSNSRLGNYEAGYSKPGPEEITIIAKITDSSACWIMFGTGPIRSSERDLQAIRHQNLDLTVAKLKDETGKYRAFLEKAETNDNALSKYIDNPFRKIGDRQSRKFERALGKRKGWMDEQHVDNDPVCSQFPEDMRELMSIYSELDTADKNKLLEIARVVKKVDE